MERLQKYPSSSTFHFKVIFGAKMKFTLRGEKSSRHLPKLKQEMLSEPNHFSFDLKHSPPSHPLPCIWAENEKLFEWTQNKYFWLRLQLKINYSDSPTVPSLFAGRGLLFFDSHSFWHSFFPLASTPLFFSLWQYFCFRVHIYILVITRAGHTDLFNTIRTSYNFKYPFMTSVVMSQHPQVNKQSARATGQKSLSSYENLLVQLWTEEVISGFSKYLLPSLHVAWRLMYVEVGHWAW